MYSKNFKFVDEDKQCEFIEWCTMAFGKRSLETWDYCSIDDYVRIEVYSEKQEVVFKLKYGEGDDDE